MTDAKKNTGQYICLVTASIILSFFLCTGIYFQGTHLNMPIWFSIFAVSGTVVYGVLSFFFSIFKRFQLTRKGIDTQSAGTNPKHNSMPFTLNPVAVWVIGATVIFLAWLPYLVVFYPGSVQYDAMYQLNMFYGIKPLVDHHPVLSTLLMGYIVQLGQLLGGNINTGIFLYTLFQSVVCASIYGYIAMSGSKLINRPYASVLIVAFFAFVPIWGAWAQTIGKDTLYYAWFALFACKYCQCVISKQKNCSQECDDANVSFHGRDWIALIITACLVISFRKEGILYIAISLIALLQIFKKQSIVCLITVSCFALFVGMISSATVDENSKLPFEAFSIPFQQSAYTYINHKEEISESDTKALGDVLRLDQLNEKYTPTNSDPVKNSAKTGASSGAIKRYLITWMKLGLDYPFDYVESFMNHIYGIFYPTFANSTLTDLKFYIQSNKNMPNELDITYLNESTDEQRKILSDFATSSQHIPVLNLLTTFGLYSWILIALIAFACCLPNKRNLLIFLPSVLCLCMCCLSPVTAYLRYCMPIMAATPILICATLRLFGESPKTCSREADCY